MITISMEKADDLMNHSVERMKTFLDDRELIASINSKKDAQNSDSIFAINEVAKIKSIAPQTERIGIRTSSATDR